MFLAQIVVSCSEKRAREGAVREPRAMVIGTCLRNGGCLFSAPIFGYPPFPDFFRILCKTGLQTAPKMGPFLRRLTLLKCNK